MARSQGREGWTREARRQLERRRWEQPILSRSREDRLLLAGERLEAERDAKVAANRAYEGTGRRVGTRGPQARSPTEGVGRAEVPEGVVSVSDPDTQRDEVSQPWIRAGV